MGSQPVDVSLRYRLTHTAWGPIVIVFVVSIVVGLVWSLATSGPSVTEGIAWTLIAAGMVLLAAAFFSFASPGVDHPSTEFTPIVVPVDDESIEQVRTLRQGPRLNLNWLWLLGGAVGYFVVASILLRF